MRNLKRAALAALFFLIFSGPAFAGMTIVRLKGSATIVRAGQSIPAAEGASLSEGDLIKTGPDGTLDFSVNGLAGCRVLPNSECRAAEAAETGMRIILSGGQTIFNLEKLPKKSSFSVETPTAIASVRGTQFTGTVNPSLGSTFSVRDDAIEVMRLEGGKPTGDPVTVEAGFSCDIPQSFAGDLNPRPATGAELTAMEQTGSVKTCG